ncbi:MAG: hypothetical protein RI973_2134 [Bacteroidota bacterium]|jgi:hypothetical protein
MPCFKYKNRAVSFSSPAFVKLATQPDSTMLFKLIANSKPLQDHKCHAQGIEIKLQA